MIACRAHIAFWAKFCPTAPYSAVQMLPVQVESSPLCFTAEGKLLSAHVYVNDGVLQVPDELRYVAAAITLKLLTTACGPNWCLNSCMWSTVALLVA